MVAMMAAAALYGFMVATMPEPDPGIVAPTTIPPIPTVPFTEPGPGFVASATIQPTPTPTPTPGVAMAPGADVDAAHHPVGAVGAVVAVLTPWEMEMVLAAAGWPPELVPDAMAVAWCESRFSPGAVGAGGAVLGLFQLWYGWFPWAGVPVERWADPVANAKVALAVARRDLTIYGTHWHQWQCKP
jgi:hypothetical protein